MDIDFVPSTSHIQIELYASHFALPILCGIASRISVKKSEFYSAAGVDFHAQIKTYKS